MADTAAKVPLLVQTILYAPAPFFCYPWKPIVNIVYGGGYQKSYKLFRMQHMNGANLFMHCLALLWQISSNYALLAELDKFCAPLAKTLGIPQASHGGWLVTRCTTLVWCAHLLGTSPTPASVKVASVLSVCLAHNFLGPFFKSQSRKVMFLQGPLEAVGVQLLLLKKPNVVGVPSVAYCVIRTALWKYLTDACPTSQMQSSKAAAIKTAVVALNLGLASSKRPLIVALFGLYGWILSLVSGDDLLYFWSQGMMATICQGIAHRIADEAGTLEVLQDDDLDQTRYELSHVTYFPNLLFQACHDHLKATCA